jgi:hypothetical protein
LASRFLLIAVAGEDGKAGILRKARVGEREIAENKDRAASGFEAAGVETIGTEAGGNPPIRCAFFLTHESSIAQEATLTDAGESRVRTRA